MHKSGRPVSFWSAVAMGIGAMVGAGIFALLGQAGAIASSAVYLSFIASGVVALLSGYSMGKLGARYPSAGGIVEYLVQAFGVGTFSGSMSVMMYLSALVSISLVAKTFGIFAASFLPAEAAPMLVNVFAAAIVLLFTAINLNGARSAARAENAVVLVKISVLIVFAVLGLVYVHPALLSPARYPPIQMIFYSVAITFFAYEGFRVITNTAEDMPSPEKTLPRAIMASIAIVMALYVAIALAVFGQLTADEVTQAQDYALAQAAKPVFGETGFRIIALAALFSTASAINAALYAVSNVTYGLAKLGELPAVFGKPIAHSREGLVISALLILVLAIFFDLSQIAAIGAVSLLLVHFVVHLGHLRLIRETRASRALILLAALTNLSAIGLSAFYLSQTTPRLLVFIAGLFGVSVALELTLRLITGRKVRPRIPRPGPPSRARTIPGDSEPA